MPGPVTELKPVPLVNDVVTLQPMAFRDSVLVFYAKAKNSYSCLTTLLYNNYSTYTTVNIIFTGTPSPAATSCKPGPYPAPGNSIYTRGYPNGKHAVSISLGTDQTTYTGTMTVTDDQYIFDWPDNVPVVFSPKQISKHH